MRISATTLESFRLFCEPEQEWMTEESLIATIKGEFKPTPAVDLGRAFGKVLETPERFLVDGGYQCEGYSFDDATMQPCFALIDRQGVFEAKALKAYGRHTVVAKADHLLGAHMSEFKTTINSFDFDKYAESCQWRFMADIFEPKIVTYNIFRLDDHENGVVTLRDIETFNLFPYVDLHQDCCELLGRFVDYVTAKGLAGILDERQRRAEAA